LFQRKNKKKFIFKKALKKKQKFININFSLSFFLILFVLFINKLTKFEKNKILFCDDISNQFIKWVLSKFSGIKMNKFFEGFKRTKFAGPLLYLPRSGDGQTKFGQNTKKETVLKEL
jgi:hypothetical protein